MNKVIKISILSLFVIGAFASCGDNKKPDRPEEMAKEQNEANLKDRPEEEDNSELLVDIIHTQLYEVELGKTGKEHGTNSKIKEFANEIESSHQKRLDKLYALASDYKYAVPSNLSDLQWNDVKKLSDKKSKDFDQKWLNEVISTHNKAVDNLVKGIEDVNDAKMKEELNATLQEVRVHLESATQLQNYLFKK